MTFHVQLRAGNQVTRVFNLEEAQVHERFLAPIHAGVPFEFESKQWDPATLRLLIIEGEHMAPGQLGPGQGWTNAARAGTDVTQRFLTAPAPDTQGPSAEVVRRLQERIVGRLYAGELSLAETLGLSADLLAGQRASVRLAAAEIAVWELIHAGGFELGLSGKPVPAAQWEALVLEPDSWLRAGPDSPVIRATA
ncbi:MAG: hypothetical protein J2O48_05305 [Solirubrobacterales bacterium]|nr:hypothetical protein [Solirubrobacterales bacterium]